jgi:membrane protease YdiL (CAAX protease family)
VAAHRPRPGEQRLITGEGDVRPEFDHVVRRLVLVARALGFVTLTYFLPSLVRDLIGYAVPGGSLIDAFGGSPPWVALGSVTVAVALSALFVYLYSRTGPEADLPHPLLRLDPRWLRGWALGSGIGLIAASLAVLPMLVVGAVRLSGWSSTLGAAPGAFLGLMVVLVLISAHEELGFRGPALRDLGRAVSFPLAAIFLAGSFALAHGVNPEIGRRGMTGVFLAGMALAGLVRWRGDLSVAVGVHAGWNIAVGLLWSVPVSGFHLTPRLLEADLVGPPAWTGGAFGVEGSIPGIVVLALATAASWGLPAAQSPAEPPILEDSPGSTPPPPTRRT